MRLGHVWLGMAGNVRTGYARCGMERQCLAGEARFVPFRYVRERMGSVRQAIKGGKLFMVYKKKDGARLKTDAQTIGEISER